MAKESIRLDGALIGKAKIIGNALSRSPAKQIEHWAKIGRMMEDNSDLSYEFVKDAIKSLIEEPLLGQQKKGDLAYLRVFKFKMVNQLTLLGYSYVDGVVILELLNIGSHENFYRDMKRN